METALHNQKTNRENTLTHILYIILF